LRIVNLFHEVISGYLSLKTLIKVLTILTTGKLHYHNRDTKMGSSRNTLMNVSFVITSDFASQFREGKSHTSEVIKENLKEVITENLKFSGFPNCRNKLLRDEL